VPVKVLAEYPYGRFQMKDGRCCRLFLVLPELYWIFDRLHQPGDLLGHSSTSARLRNIIDDVTYNSLPGRSGGAGSEFCSRQRGGLFYCSW
jgi:hypothetical protein